MHRLVEPPQVDLRTRLTINTLTVQKVPCEVLCKVKPASDLWALGSPA